MSRFIRMLVLASLALLGTCEVCLADTIAITAKSWGLIGAWKVDCNTDNSETAALTKYVERDGQLFQDRDWGAGKDSSAVVSAQIVDQDFVLTVKFNGVNGTQQWALRKQRDGRIRTIWNRNVDTDQYSIRDGKFTANGNSTLWQTHCRRDDSN